MYCRAFSVKMPTKSGKPSRRKRVRRYSRRVYRCRDQADTTPATKKKPDMRNGVMKASVYSRKLLRCASTNSHVPSERYAAAEWIQRPSSISNARTESSPCARMTAGAGPGVAAAGMAYRSRKASRTRSAGFSR